MDTNIIAMTQYPTLISRPWNHGGAPSSLPTAAFAGIGSAVGVAAGTDVAASDAAAPVAAVKTATRRSGPPPRREPR